MRIVIDIPEKDYEKIKKAHWFEGHDTILDRVYLAIKQGARLPESHGRLIDADAYKEHNNNILDCEIDHPKYQDTLRELIDNAPTIIEAEKEGDI